MRFNEGILFPALLSLLCSGWSLQASFSPSSDKRSSGLASRFCRVRRLGVHAEGRLISVGCFAKIRRLGPCCMTKSTVTHQHARADS
jgi:hypothetical protein